MIVAIKDMKMPECCFRCPFFEKVYCMVSNERKVPESVFAKKKAEWCPLVEVAMSRSNLISADEVIKYMETGEAMEPITKAVREYVKEIIRSFPTAFEVEKTE